MLFIGLVVSRLIVFLNKLAKNNAFSLGFISQYNLLNVNIISILDLIGLFNKMLILIEVDGD